MTTAGEVTTIYTLQSSNGISILTDLLQAADGRLYGTASQGGAVNFGTIFAVTPEGAFEKLHDFSQADGEWSYSGLVEADPGNLYGMTSLGDLARAA